MSWLMPGAVCYLRSADYQYADTSEPILLVLGPDRGVNQARVHAVVIGEGVNAHFSFEVGQHLDPLRSLLFPVFK